MKERYKDAVHQLIQHGANTNAQNKDGETPVHIATKNNDKAISQVLLLGEADLNLKRNDGWCPLHIAGQSSVPQKIENAIIYLDHKLTI